MLYSPLGPTWQTADLSYSFVPDGSEWQGSTSVLRAALGEIAQRDFARALQTWANQTNLNFHLSTDQGTRDGIQGDIRLAAIHHALGLGNATPPSSSASGGDVTIDADHADYYADRFDLYSLLLHESGHALGLAHSDNDGSVMEPYINWFTERLSPDDIAGIQSLYGVRNPDTFDQASPNNSFSSATLLALNNHDADRWRADLTSQADVDYYRFTATVGATSASIAVDARELSLLAPKVAVYDQLQNLVATASGGYGTVAKVDIPVVAGRTYTIVADGATSDEFGMGAYHLNMDFQQAGPSSTLDPYVAPPTSPVVTAPVPASGTNSPAGNVPTATTPPVVAPPPLNAAPSTPPTTTNPASVVLRAVRRTRPNAPASNPLPSSVPLIGTVPLNHTLQYPAAVTNGGTSQTTGGTSQAGAADSASTSVPSAPAASSSSHQGGTQNSATSPIASQPPSSSNEAGSSTVSLPFLSRRVSRLAPSLRRAA